MALTIAIFLIVCENLAHDCAPGRNPTHKLIPPDDDDEYIERIRKIRMMVHENSKFIIWRQAIIISMILPFPIIYFLKGRLPTLFEFIIVALMIFISVYFSYMWLWSRYFYPNTAKMEKSLFEMEELLDGRNVEVAEKISAKEKLRNILKRLKIEKRKTTSKID